MEDMPLLDRFKEIKVTICNRCRGFLVQHKWIYGKIFTEAIEETARAAIKGSADELDINPVFVEEPKIKPGIKVKFEIKVIARKGEEEEEYTIPARLEVTYCPKCSLIGTRYFEGILQLRNPNQEVIDFVRNDIKESRTKGIHLTKEVKEGDGIDFYVTDQKYVQALARRMHERFGGDLKVTSRLFSKNQQTSKDVYRVTSYLKLPNIKVGQIVHKGKRILKVEHTGKKVHLIDTKTGKKITMSYERLG